MQAMQASLRSSASELHRPSVPLRNRSAAPRLAPRRVRATFDGGRKVNAVSEKDKVVQQVSRVAAEAVSSLKQVATQTEKALQGLPSKDVLAQQAENLKAQAIEASSKLSGLVGQVDPKVIKETSASLFSAAEALRSQSLGASSQLASSFAEVVQSNKSKVLQLVQAAPEPIQDIAETAVTAHSPDAVKKGAVIHDFCLGITYGGILVVAGLLWFVLSGSINALRFGLLLGGVILAAGIGSMNAWKAGKSSTPYIAVQAVTSFVIFAQEVARYSVTKHIFPTALVAVSSIAMLAFYVYVVLAGGNPPPKKKAVAAPEPSAA